MQTLAGLDLIITRPTLQAKAWQRQAESLGAHTRLLPVLEIEAVSDDKSRDRIRQQILALADCDKAIFVSQNAVHQAMEWIDQLWPQFPQLQWFAIGSATAKAAIDWGLSVSAAGDAMTSEVLLNLPALQGVSGEKIVIFRGVGGRNLLAEQLRKRGASVEYCELYHRRVPALAEQQWRDVRIDPMATTLIAVHSGESLDNLAELIVRVARPAIKQLPVLVPGERVAANARQCGFTRIVTAENATDAAMLRALREWYSGMHAAPANDS